MKVRINRTDFTGSFSDGPGIRSLVFMQGCTRHCKGCHNPSTWNPNEGQEIEISDLVAVIRENCINRKITITGGEPLLQMKALEELLDQLQDFDICLYTGYEYDEVPEYIKSRTTYLKAGPYIEELRKTTIPFYGSTNQKFIRMR